MYRIKRNSVAALDLAFNHWPLGSVLGVFFHKFAK